MARETERGGPARSVAEAFHLVRMGAPLHPIFVHFTIALTASSLAFDALGFLLNIESLSAAGAWTLAGAVVMTVFTLGSGVSSRLRLPVEEGEARSFLRAHMALGPIFFGLLLGLGIWRTVLWDAGIGVTGWYLGAMVSVALVMTLQGYLGGELVYRYGAEVEQSYRTLPGQKSTEPAPALRPSGVAIREEAAEPSGAGP